MTADGFPDHPTCLALTSAMLQHLPESGSASSHRRVSKGTPIWSPDDRGDGIYFLERGEIRISNVDPQGRELLLQVVSPEGLFGEVCLCAENDGRRGTFARAGRSSTVLHVPQREFLDLLRGDDARFLALLGTFCRRLARCETTAQILSHRGAQERLARLLLQLAGSVPRRDADRPGLAIIASSHQTLAQLAAMSRPHVSVTLGHFRRIRLVDYARGRALGVDETALARYLEQLLASEGTRGAMPNDVR